MLIAMTIIASTLWVLGYYALQGDAISENSDPYEYVLLFFLWPFIVLTLIYDDLRNLNR